jgi:hypothetical protein
MVTMHAYGDYNLVSYGNCGEYKSLGEDNCSLCVLLLLLELFFASSQRTPVKIPAPGMCLLKKPVKCCMYYW